VAVDDVSDI